MQEDWLSGAELGWAWSTAALVTWVILAHLGLGIFFRWFGRRIAEDERFDRALLSRLYRLAYFGSLVAAVYVWMWLAPLPRELDEFMRSRVQPWFWYTLALIAWVIGGVYFTRRAVGFLADRAERTHATVDDALAAAIRRPLYILLLVGGINIWSVFVPLPGEFISLLNVSNLGFAVLIFILFVDSFIQSWLTLRAATNHVLATSGGVLRTAARVLVWSTGVLVMLATLDIDITPLITTLGIGSLAFGLALQKTLEDFLAGLLIAADQPIRVGDFIELESGEAGFVLAIGWRTTRLRTREDMHVIVPNGKLAQATLINRNLPNAEVSFTVPIGIHYESNLDKAAESAVDVATRLQQSHALGVTGFRPKVVYESFNASSIDFRVWMRARTWDEHFAFRDAFIRELQQRFAADGIIIPYPIRTVQMESSSPNADTSEE